MNQDERYQEIARHLKRLFEFHGRTDAEDLAQAAIARGLRKMADGVPVTGDPGAYFYGIGRKMLMERTRPSEPLPDEWGAEEARFLGLGQADIRILVRQALARLKKSDRSLFTAYVGGERQYPGYSPEAVRVKFFRLRKQLQAWCEGEIEKK